MTKSIRVAALVWLALGAVLAVRAATAEEKPTAFVLGGRHPTKQLNVAVVTGGHPFNKAEFLKLFQGYDDIAYVHLPQKTGGELFENIDNWPYDVIVLYNFNQQITPKQQKNFLWLLDRGVGLVILHHANDAYPHWPQYAEISGVQSHFAAWQQNGVSMAPSDFSRGLVPFKVHVADTAHPITRGLADYDCRDETYCRRSFDPGVHPLLTTTEPSSDKLIGWTKTSRKAWVVYIQSGHDETTYHNPTYRTLVVRAIRWTGGRLQ
jgi:hypothetical protein